MKLPARLRARAAALRGELDDPELRRRRREDLVTPLATIAGVLFVVVAVLSYGLLYIASNAQEAAGDARDAASLAVENTERIAEVERDACVRLQRVRSSTNRNGAIIYVVLSAVSGNVRRSADASNAQEYRTLGRLPKYDPRVDCREASDPDYESPALIPFAELPRGTFLELLPKGTVDRILGPDG